MRISVVKDYRAVSESCARLIASYVRDNPGCRLCLAAGGSVVGTYEKLAELAKSEGISFSDTTVFSMDDYVGLTKSDPNSFYYFMKKHLYDKLDIKLENTCSPQGDAVDMQEACGAFTKRVKDIGGFDFILLGIGPDGHIAFNMPSDVFQMDTHLATLSEETVQTNSRFFENAGQVPRQAITIGAGMIMSSKKVVMIASGKTKAAALAEWLNNRVITPKLQASVLWMHPDVTLIIDEEAAGKLKAN